MGEGEAARPLLIHRISRDNSYQRQGGERCVHRAVLWFCRARMRGARGCRRRGAAAASQEVRQPHSRQLLQLRRRRCWLARCRCGSCACFPAVPPTCCCAAVLLLGPQTTRSSRGRTPKSAPTLRCRSRCGVEAASFPVAIPSSAAGAPCPPAAAQAAAPCSAAAGAICRPLLLRLRLPPLNTCCAGRCPAGGARLQLHLGAADARAGERQPARARRRRPARPAWRRRRRGLWAGTAPSWRHGGRPG